MSHSASMRELLLRATNDKGEDFPKGTLAEIDEEQGIIAALGFGETLADEIAFKIRRRGTVLDYRRMCLQIMSVPSEQGYTRKAMRQIGSLMDKLEDAAGKSDVLLEEGEWKFLRDRIEGHKFPNYSRGIRIFCDSVIDETEKVAVGKVENLKKSGE